VAPHIAPGIGAALPAQTANVGLRALFSLRPLITRPGTRQAMNELQTPIEAGSQVVETAAFSALSSPWADQVVPTSGTAHSRARQPLRPPLAPPPGPAPALLPLGPACSSLPLSPARVRLGAPRPPGGARAPPPPLGAAGAPLPLGPASAPPPADAEAGPAARLSATMRSAAGLRARMHQVTTPAHPAGPGELLAIR